MTRNWLFLTALVACCVGAPACEDNPDGIYKRAPAGAGSYWNDSRSPGVFDPNAKNGFTDSYGARSRQEICSGPEKAKKWAQMVKQDIVPLRNIAGLDLAGGDQWTGLDFRDAEKTLCQSNPSAGTSDQLGARWGDSGEVEVLYRVATNTIDQFQLNQGYRGKLRFKSRPHDYNDKTKPNPRGIHEWELGVGEQALKDGKPWEINWLKGQCAKLPNGERDPNDDCLPNQATDLFDAMNATFDPGALSTQADCIAARVCRAKVTPDGGAAFGNRALGMYFAMNTIAKGQPLASTPSYFYGFYVKLLPFSAPELFLKLDGEGPIATSTELGDLKKTCVQRLGMPFKEFNENCLNVNSDPALNALNLGKLEGGMSHDKEAFDFSIEGVNLDFLSSRVGDDKVVADEDRPQPEDRAHEFNMDIRAQGRGRNEYDADNKVFTLQGSGNIYREYARIVQDDIRKKMRAWAEPRSPMPNGQCEPGWAPGERRCVAPNRPAKPTTEQGTCEQGYTLEVTCQYEGFGIGDGHCLEDKDGFHPSTACTGFESVVTPAPHATSTNPDFKKGSIGVAAMSLGYTTVLAAGDPQIVFCVDPSPNVTGGDEGTECTSGGDSACWSNHCGEPDPAQGNRRFCDNPLAHYYAHCDGASGGFGGLLLETSYRRVLNVLGKGKLENLPPELRDRKYFFKQWAWAMVKYLKAANKFPLDLTTPEFMPGGDACVPPVPPGQDPSAWKARWLSNCDPEPDHLLFDQIGETGQLDKFEYIDRRFVSSGQDPLKIEYQIAIDSSNQSDWKFHRKLTRPERALYKALQVDRTQPPASADDNVRITNIVGSPILKNGWRGPGTDVPGQPGRKKDGYYCATTLINGRPDPECGSSQPPRDSRTGELMLDDYGQPLLTNYRGAFTGTVFSIGTKYIRLQEELPFIKSARIKLPFFPDPYSPTEGATAVSIPTPELLVDWRPETPGNGTRIPIDGQIDKFIPSATLSFSGSSLGFDLDYQLLPGGAVKVDGVQSDSYQGNLFLCKDDATGDLLSVEQYESMSTILDWIERHPSATSECDLLIRYSAFNTFPSLLAARQAGIVLVVGQGSGAGRITSVEIYDPSL